MKMKFTIHFFKEFVFVMLIGLSVFTYGSPADSTKLKPRLNIGVNFTTVSLMPFLSFDYQFAPKLGFTLELSPSFKNYLPDAGWVNTNIIVHAIRPEETKFHFTPALELSFFRETKTDYKIPGHHPKNPCDGPSTLTEVQYYRKTRMALVLMFFYGNPKFKVFYGLGVGKVRVFARGYQYYDGALLPYLRDEDKYLPHIKVGLRMGIFFPPENTKKQSKND